MINFTEIYQMVFMVVVGVVMTTTMFMTMMSFMMEDWMVHTEEQLNLRQEVLQILFKKFGKGDYSNKSIYECADEWVAKGHKISSGIVKYYDAYYNTDK